MSNKIDLCINSLIGNTMKRMRQINNIKVGEMANHIDISESYLSEIENGKKNINIKFIKKYSKAFGIELSDFFLLHDYLLYEAKDNLVKLLVHDKKARY